MAEKNVVNTPVDKPARRWPRKLGIAGAITLGLLLVFYFIATSAAFLKGFVLPRVSKALGATITIEDASISPFSSVSLRGLKVQTTGDPLVQAGSASVRYSLMDIIGGKISVSELTLDSPNVVIVQNADGSGNLDPILKALSASQAPPKPAAPKSAKPPQLDLRNIALKNASFHFRATTTNHIQKDIELASINLTIDQLRNGISGKFDLSTEIGFSQGPAGGKVADLVRTKAAANFDFAVTTELKPEHIKGKTTVDITSVQGAFADLGGLKGVLDLDLAMTEIKKLDLNFTRSGTELGSIRVSGPYTLNLDAGPGQLPVKEGHIKVAISSIDRSVLNLVGAPLGIDFNSTTINSVTDLVVDKAARTIDVGGQFDLGKFSVTRQGQTTPALDLKAVYQVSVDQSAQSARIQGFTIDGTQKANPLLRAALSQPLTVTWSTNSAAVDAAGFELKVNKLNLADWKPFLGEAKPAGIVDLDLRLNARQAGRNLDLDLTTSVSDLAAQVASNRISQAGISLKVRGQVADFKKISLPEYSLKITRAGKHVVSLTGSAQFDAGTQDADIQATLDTAVPQLTQLLGRPDLQATAGSVQFSGRITQNVQRAGGAINSAQTVIGNLKLADLTGNFTDYRLDKFGVGFDCEVVKTNDTVQIHQLKGQVTSGAKSGGRIDVTGNFDLKKQAGSASLKLADLNEVALKPFAGPALGKRTLGSVSINCSLEAGFTGQGDGTIKGSLDVSNLLVVDPEKLVPNVPLALGIQLDAAMANQLLTLRQFNGKTTFGGDAAGSFEITGGFDLKKQSGQAALKLVDLNQNALRPFVEPALGGGKKLASISINSAVAAKYDLKGDSIVKGDLSLANLLLTDPEKKLPNVPLTATLQIDAAYGRDMASIRKIGGKVLFGKDAAGDFDVTGVYDPKKRAGQGSLKLTGLNENALRPFLGQSLGDKSLVSIAVNANATARYDATGDSAVKADFAVTNLVVNDPKNPSLRTPLSAQFQLDTSLNKNIVDLRQFQIALSPTARAKNQLNLAGKVDLTQTNATMAKLTLSADSMDVTPFYDLFDNPEKVKPAAKSARAPKAPPAPATPPSNVEPAPVNLPLRQSTIEVNIGKFYLREINVANLSMKTSIDGGKVKVQPLQFTINNAPVTASADFDLGVPGYKYTVALKADKIPVEPIANSFSPDYSGQAKGDVIASVQVKGAGITGKNLQQNLDGSVFLSFTNANIAIVSPRWKPVVMAIALALQVPEIAKSPINYLNADVALGNGQMNFRKFIVHSDAFLAESSGIVPIREVLNDSPLDLPVEISLANSFTSKYRSLLPASSPGYMKLPSFLTINGTLGDPKEKINYAKLTFAGVEGVATGALGNVGSVGGKAGSIIKGVTGLFGPRNSQDQPQDTNNPAQTNQPPAQADKPGVFDFFKKPRK